MYKEVEVKLSPDHINDPASLERAIAKTAKVQRPFTHKILRKSIDARGSTAVFRLRVGVAKDEELPSTASYRSSYSTGEGRPEVHIIGAGPAGYFAALECLEQGLRPIVLDRGVDVRARRRDLKAIQQDGIVNPHSNYCFGEGGAGTYSDGKLYTRAHKRGSIRKVLHLLVEHGAQEDILQDAHPHIGSNKLPHIIAAMRATIEGCGGEVRFGQYVTDITAEKGRVASISFADETSIEVQHVILATGHSARDIYELFSRKQWTLEAKEFALGVRIEHPQALIDKQQYGTSPRHENLPAASYSLATQVEETGVFSFCMCPGGLIVPAATAPGELVVNGMSLSRRDSPYANSGFVTAVDEKDWAAFEVHGELAGLAYQRDAERRIFEAGDGSQKAPAQLIEDFIAGRLSPKLNPTSYIPGLYSAPIHELLPAPVAARLQKGLKQLTKKIKGYTTNAGQIVGIESRTSSPVRIPRDKETLQHQDVAGLYPCGEGAGFAGGILSAAMDGQKVAKMIAATIKK
ncbi:MAG: NAD(P)/FAD-dependent oxidoreductase [Saprospiraceae bacterium]